MHIHHIAIWTHKLERLKDFYLGCFCCQVSELYLNRDKKFASYFLTFDSGAKIELMSKSGIDEYVSREVIGYSHIAIELENMKQVDEYTALLENAGVEIVSHPRITGDGYYESVILDPDKNKIELVAKQIW